MDALAERMQTPLCHHLFVLSSFVIPFGFPVRLLDVVLVLVLVLLLVLLVVVLLVVVFRVFVSANNCSTVVL